MEVRIEEAKQQLLPQEETKLPEEQPLPSGVSGLDPSASVYAQMCALEDLIKLQAQANYQQNSFLNDEIQKLKKSNEELKQEVRDLRKVIDNQGEVGPSTFSSLLAALTEREEEREQEEVKAQENQENEFQKKRDRTLSAPQGRRNSQKRVRTESLKNAGWRK